MNKQITTPKNWYLTEKWRMISMSLLSLALFMGVSILPVTAALKNQSNKLAINRVNNIGIGNIKVDIAIKGKVTDRKTSEPLIGVSVKIKGTNVGASTDVNGNYSLNAPENGILVFSIIGYISQELPVNGSASIDMTLQEDLQSLNEVVIVGYGTQKRTSVTAAVSSLNGAKIAAVPVANMSNAIGGRLPGLIVRQNSGEPGKDGSNIFIRGVSTTGNSQPLLVVDGIRRAFQNLDPSTIENITVLKDAAAVAPFGIAGANGVILITTKRGKTGMPTITYNSFMGVQNPTVLPELPTAYEYATLKNAASVNVGGKPLYTDPELQKFKDGSDPDAYPNQNIYDMLFKKNSPLTTHNIELAGGAERVKYYGSVGYQHQGGIWAPTYQNRFNYTMNIDADVTKTTKISLNINGREQVNNAPTVTTGRLFELVHYASPIRPVLFSNGESGEYIWNNVFNSGDSRTNTSQMYSQLSIEQELSFIPGLKAKATFAFDPTQTRNKAFRTPSHLWSVNTTTTPYTFIDGIFEQSKPSLSQSMVYSRQLTYQGSLNYDRTFGKSNIGGLVLFEANSNDDLTFGAGRRNYNLSIGELSMGSSSLADMSNFGSSSSARQMGVVYRATYAYDNKYLFEASGRYDGSYYFSADKRFGFFPAFSLGYRLSEEKFMQNISWLDNLKIRGSYGEVGAIAGAPFQYLSLYNIYGPGAVLGGGAVQAASEAAESNPNITWERAKKTNIGLEISLWKGLLNLEADYFYERRSNMLTNPIVVVPVEYGIGLSQINAGEMENRGIDLTLSSTYNASKFNVTVGSNFTFAKNKLLQVYETATTYNNPNRRITGRPLGTRFGYESLGYFQVEDFNNGKLLPGIATQNWGAVFPGDLRYKDLNGDGKIDNNDIKEIGEADVPQIIYGIFSTVSYKSLSLDVLFQGAGKTNIYGPAGYWHPFNNGRGAYKSNMDYWTPENRNASHTRITPSPTSNNNQASSYLMFNSRYLRLKNINLSYTIPMVLSKKVGVQNARIFVSGQNLLTFTPIINYDPEIINSQALDYPQQRVISAGINLTLF
jgi:TonB-linked SusC/RagA family outer membrane protein